ncbi:unnamed protein product, partial [Oppiella nova]
MPDQYKQYESPDREPSLETSPPTTPTTPTTLTSHIQELENQPPVPMAIPIPKPISIQMPVSVSPALSPSLSRTLSSSASVSPMASVANGVNGVNGKCGPIHRKSRDVSWCKQLVRNGANPNLSNHDGWHPLHLAAYHHRNNETLTYLINCNTNKGMTTDVLLVLWTSTYCKRGWDQRPLEELSDNETDYGFLRCTPMKTNSDTSEDVTQTHALSPSQDTEDKSHTNGNQLKDCIDSTKIF